ncbi:ABC transporter ATP-binding protein [Williamsia sp.]|uniref:ABC transporter ATP-binding protein n=1 Tax=Williamsia sp. TaxID=1872085 RepID=UPI002F945A9A
MTALELSQLRVGYRRHRLGGHDDNQILQTSAITADAGVVTAVIGANGTGKSTLLRTLAGLQSALGGSARLGDHELLTMSPAARAREVAVVLTDRVDDSGLLTARALVELGRIPYHSWVPGRSSATEAIVDDALAQMGASAFADRRIGELSDGQRQRVLIARALAQEPQLLILDEPSSFLDVAARTELLLVLRKLAAETGIVVVMSTHDVEVALRIVGPVWLARRDGNLVAATADQLVQDGTIAGEFDSPTVRFNSKARLFEPRP